MTTPTEGSAPQIGDQVDESAVTPSPKAHVPPLQPPDVLHLRVDLQPDGISLEGKARVGRGMHSAIDYAVVCITSMVAVTVAVLLSYLCNAPGWATFMIATTVAGLIMMIGLIRTKRHTTATADAPEASSDRDNR